MHTDQNCLKPTVLLPGDYLIIGRGGVHGSQLYVYRPATGDHLMLNDGGGVCLYFPDKQLSVSRAHKFAEFVAALFNLKAEPLDPATNKFAKGFTKYEIGFEVK